HRHVNSVAIGRVIPTLSSTKVAEDHGACLHANTGRSELSLEFCLLPDEVVAERRKGECAAHGARRMVRFRHRRAEEGVYGIADDLVYCSAVIEDNAADTI